jgi:hypothetical protein
MTENMPRQPIFFTLRTQLSKRWEVLKLKTCCAFCGRVEVTVEHVCGAYETLNSGHDVSEDVLLVPPAILVLTILITLDSTKEATLTIR